MQNDFNLHVENTNLSREEKNYDKKRGNKENTICSAVFDLQQVLITPKIEVGEAYYKKKLSTYNFTIYDLGKEECSCYMWNETVA
ncbi:hypothetical protein ILUMI_18834, partial [Ignelater luminosus]